MILFIFISWFLWRVGLFAVAALGETLLPFTPRFPYSDVFFFPSGLPQWVWSFANFDGVHYLTIIRHGYAAQFTQVFFPSYPLIIRGIHEVVPFISDIVLGIAFSSLCFGLALYMFMRLLRLDYTAEQTRWIILFLITFPTSFFFGTLYTESLFFLLVVSSFYWIRKKHFWMSGLFGGLAAATRIVGIVLLPALLWEMWEEEKVKSQKSKVKNMLPVILQSPMVYVIPLGLVIYMAYLQFVFGDALYFWHVQPVFGAGREGSSIVLLPQVLWRYGKILMTLPYTVEPFWIALLEVSSVMVSFGLLWWAYKKGVRISYILFSLICVIIPTLTGTLSSMPRYVLVAFPMYIVLGLIPSHWLKIGILIGMMSLQVLLTILFTRGHWVS